MEGLLDSLYLLIPVSVVLVFVIGGLFWWSLRTGQYDDLEGPAYRLLLEDDDLPPVPAQGDDADQSHSDRKTPPG